MTKQEIRARLEAIDYIIENKLYSLDMESEILSEAKHLSELLLGSNNSPNESTDDILEQRRSQYGSYDTFVRDMREILNILTIRRDKQEVEWEILDIENFFFVLKLLRLQTADDIDSIRDLEGYAKLARVRRES